MPLAKGVPLGLAAGLWQVRRSFCETSVTIVIEPGCTKQGDSVVDEDMALIERFQAGDKTAFDELMQRHYRAVLNIIYRFTGTAGPAAEDMAQDIFLRVFRALPRFEARAKFFTFLYKVTMNYCFKARQQENKRRNRTCSLNANWDDPSASPAKEPADPGGSALDAVTRSELCVNIRQAVMALPDEQRAAVVLYRFRHCSYEEIADILGISLAAVKSRLHRAKLTLQKSLTD